ncbi:hypothetical protein LP52_08710 [Streptomonospora alba]|uniref:Copper chaperone n=1 Tax=Streptomonospora alba TaxID=183763 RepID=A0A0C2JQW7_9ACTN|nr:copper chaperone PCu(A)C [Streptomonospora alba]KIH99202.1 hypothetical protein LP52_08710 [Streptomonospora alba]
MSPAAARRGFALGAAALAVAALAGCGGGSGGAAAPSATAATADGAAAGRDKGSASSGDISVVGAWVPEPARPDVGAAYMTVRNSGEEDDALVAASSSVSSETGIHITEASDSGAQVMKEADEVPVPAGGSARLESGGYHLMLMDIPEAPTAGEAVELTLEFGSGTEVEVRAPVLKRNDTR